MHCINTVTLLKPSYAVQVPEGIVKTLKAIDKYFIASEKFASATNFLVNQTAPYLIKPPCAKVG